ncbi:MAG TPA: serine/threonine-protein kinase, partial [Gemmatimonadaceae bacterium]
RVSATLGSGATAHVYVADDLKTGGRVAIKALREDVAASVSVARFVAEVTMAAQLKHPNIVPLYDWGTADGLPYVVMPLVDGQSLRARLNATKRLPLDEVLHICTEISAALDYAHRWRVVHRDIKPENVLLRSGHAVVLDFGISPALDAIEQPRRTLPGLVHSTPEYISPEQAYGMHVDERSDVYSLACVVYEMIWGHPPFMGPRSSVLLRHISAEPMPLGCRLSGIPQAVSAVVARALEKTPSQRFDTAGAFAAALRHGCDRSADAPLFQERQSA